MALEKSRPHFTFWDPNPNELACSAKLARHVLISCEKGCSPGLKTARYKYLVINSNSDFHEESLSGEDKLEGYLLLDFLLRLLPGWPLQARIPSLHVLSANRMSAALSHLNLGVP